MVPIRMKSIDAILLVYSNYCYQIDAGFVRSEEKF